MQNYFALAAPQLAGTGIDTSPLRNALNDYAQSQRQAKQDQIAAQDRQFERQKYNTELARQNKQDKFADIQRWGSEAKAIGLIQDPTARSAAWQRYLVRHPDYANLDATYKDPEKGPSLVAAEAGQFIDNLDRQFKQSEIDKNLAMSRNYDSESQTRQSQRDMINALIKGANPPQTPATSNFSQNGQIIPQSNTTSQTNNPNLIKASDANTPNTPQSNALSEPTIMTKFGPMTKEQARSLTALPDTGLQNFGKSLLDEFNSQSFQKTTQGEFEKRILDTTEHLANLRAIQNNYNRDFLTYKEQGKQFFTSLKEKGGFALTPEQKERRTKYVQFQQDAIDNINDMIRAATGAAMGVEEAKRLMMSEANLNDDPTAFEAKWNNSATKLRTALYRYNYLRNQQKFTGSGEDMASRMSLKGMENILDRRADQIEAELKQQFPKMQKQEMNNIILKKIDQEFGA